jgi:3-methyladenine DNA glycosylase Tag
MHDRLCNSSNRKVRLRPSSGVTNQAHRKLAKPQTASTSAESVVLSKQLKRLGWKFVGPTTVYAFMQSEG